MYARTTRASLCSRRRKPRDRLFLLECSVQNCAWRLSVFDPGWRRKPRAYDESAPGRFYINLVVKLYTNACIKVYAHAHMCVCILPFVYIMLVGNDDRRELVLWDAFITSIEMSIKMYAYTDGNDDGLIDVYLLILKFVNHSRTRVYKSYRRSKCRNVWLIEIVNITVIETLVYGARCMVFYVIITVF